MDDSSSGRLITLGTAPSGQPRILMVLVGDSTGPRRREAESVSVFFTPDGRVERGSRMAFTSGIPARSSEARNSGLLPADSARAVSLARAVGDRCRAAT